MARAAGRDVVLQLTEAVSELQAGFARQEHTIARITARLDVMAEHFAVAGARMDMLAERVEMLSQAFSELSEDQTTVRQDFAQLAQSHRETRAQLDRVARILGDGFTSTTDRLDDVEHRLARLEKKAG